MKYYTAIGECYQTMEPLLAYREEFVPAMWAYTTWQKEDASTQVNVAACLEEGANGTANRRASSLANSSKADVDDLVNDKEGGYSRFFFEALSLLGAAWGDGP